MSMGVYFHIPFCKSRCRYCDFFSTTQLSRRDEYAQSLLAEWEAMYPQMVSMFGDVRTVYFGGGTPSLLSPQQTGRLVEAVQAVQSTPLEEVTMEANPADLTMEHLKQLRQWGVNRLSIGIQSFREDELRILGRRHTAEEARQAVKMAQDAGFDNISIDLIYALPNQTMEDWQYNIAEALKLNIQHISCYCLSYEDGTPMTQALMRGEIEEADDDLANEMLDELTDQLQAHGFEHYEVSNFALPGMESRHNSSYWNDTPYLGLGAGAHSYDGKKRWWNAPDLDAYLSTDFAETSTVVERYMTETLTEEQKHIEKVMLGLRTARGIELSLVKDSPHLAQCLQDGDLETYMKDGITRLKATRKGIHILNRIIEELI